ncbi:MAG: IS200/IS605 family transposase [Cyanobacteriota bacterium]|nr:IS200/IS605 family transposase [Cyanobacteriota bacterium]
MAKLSKQDLEYRRDNHSVSVVNYHFVFVPKRRKAVLGGDIKQKLQEVIFSVVKERGWHLIALEIMPDHVHFLVNVPPKHSASQVAMWVKGRAAKILREEFPELCRLPSLWSPSYFVGSVGNVSTEIVRKYIESQTGK